MGNSWQRMLLFLCLLSGTDQLSFVSARAEQQRVDQAEHYAAQVAMAAQNLIKLTPADQLEQLQQPFSTSKRISGRDAAATPSFCGVLAWCRPQGLRQGLMSREQLFGLNRLLRFALSSGGYQHVLGVMNRQRVIGEMENISDDSGVRRAVQKYPNALSNSIADFSEFARPSLRDWYPSIGGTFAPPEERLDWSWKTPGLPIRRHQFNDYSLLITGDPGKGDYWGLRYEGHHLSINLTFMRDELGKLSVAGTPLFLGAFPMVVPQSPSTQNRLITHWEWTQGQLMLFGAAHHLRQFWLSMEDSLRGQGRIPVEKFEQVAPLLSDVPPPFLISALNPAPHPQTIEEYSAVLVDPRQLSGETIWHLRQGFEVYLSSLHDDVASELREKINSALSGDEPFSLSWAGGDLKDMNSHHYSYLQVGDLLLELLQSNEFSTQHVSAPSGNHIHGMLRDLSFDWVHPNPAEGHLIEHHHNNMNHHP